MYFKTIYCILVNHVLLLFLLNILMYVKLLCNKENCKKKKTYTNKIEVKQF